MWEPLAALVALQQVDSELERTGHEVAATKAALGNERVVQEARARAAKAVKSEQATRDELNAAEKALTETERRIAMNEHRITSGAITTQRDLTAVEHELAFLRQARSEHDERVLLAMEASDRATEEVRMTAERLAQIQAERAAEIIRLQEQLEAAQAHFQDLTRQRPIAAQAVEPALLARYEGIRKVRDRAVVAAHNGVCQGCRVNLLPIATQRLRGNTPELVTCGNCGRILYLA